MAKGRETFHFEQDLAGRLASFGLVPEKGDGWN
jgi:hypothetical protein